MKQKKLNLCVYDVNHDIIFEKQIASFQDVNSAISLFDEIGNEISVMIEEFDPKTLNSHEG